MANLKPADMVSPRRESLPHIHYVDVTAGFFTIAGAIVNLYAAYQSSKPAQTAVTTEFIVTRALKQ